MRHLAISLSGILVPGLGHLILRRRARGLAFFGILTTLFAVGVLLDRDFYIKFGEKNLLARVQEAARGTDPNEMSDPLRSEGDEMEGAVDRAWKFIFIYFYPFFVGLANYVVGYYWSEVAGPMVRILPFVANPAQVPVSVKDIGYCFALLAGLLNLLVMMDAHDIAVNEEDLGRRRAVARG